MIALLLPLACLIGFAGLATGGHFARIGVIVAVLIPVGVA